MNLSSPEFMIPEVSDWWPTERFPTIPTFLLHLGYEWAGAQSTMHTALYSPTDETTALLHNQLDRLFQVLLRGAASLPDQCDREQMLLASRLYQETKLEVARWIGSPHHRRAIQRITHLDDEVWQFRNWYMPGRMARDRQLGLMKRLRDSAPCDYPALFARWNLLFVGIVHGTGDSQSIDWFKAGVSFFELTWNAQTHNLEEEALDNYVSELFASIESPLDRLMKSQGGRSEADLGNATTSGTSHDGEQLDPQADEHHAFQFHPRVFFLPPRHHARHATVEHQLFLVTGKELLQETGNFRATPWLILELQRQQAKFLGEAVDLKFTEWTLLACLSPDDDTQWVDHKALEKHTCLTKEATIAPALSRLRTKLRAALANNASVPPADKAAIGQRIKALGMKRHLRYAALRKQDVLVIP